MSDQLPQPSAPEPQHVTSALDVVHGALKVGESIPALCDARDLAHIFGCAIATVYAWQHDGKLRRFELRRPIGTRRWSGKLLQRYVDSEFIAAAAMPARKSA